MNIIFNVVVYHYGKSRINKILVLSFIKSLWFFFWVSWYCDRSLNLIVDPISADFTTVFFIGYQANFSCDSSVQESQPNEMKPPSAIRQNASLMWCQTSLPFSASNRLIPISLLNMIHWVNKHSKARTIKLALRFHVSIKLIFVNYTIRSTIFRSRYTAHILGYINE